MKSFKIVWFVFLMVGIVSCETEDDEPYSGICDKAVIVEGGLYNEVDTENYNIRSAVINGDCLEVKISSGGCDGGTWETKLVDSGNIAESFPPQRFLKISLKNEEPCYAIVTKKISFDLSSIRTEGGQVILNLENWEEGLLYIAIK